MKLQGDDLVFKDIQKYNDSKHMLRMPVVKIHRVKHKI